MANGKKKRHPEPQTALDVPNGDPAGERHGSPRLGDTRGTFEPDRAAFGRIFSSHWSSPPTDPATATLEQSALEGRAVPETRRERAWSSTVSSHEEGFHWHGYRQARVPVADGHTESSAAGADVSSNAKNRLLRMWSMPTESERSSDLPLNAPAMLNEADKDAAVAERDDRATPGAPGRPVAGERGDPTALLQSIAASTARMAESVEALRASMEELRDWLRRLSPPESGERGLGRLVANAELLVERGIEDAEERARSIIAAATERAERIVATAGVQESAAESESKRAR